MKINPYTDVSKNAAVPKSQKDSVPAGKDFNALFKEALGDQAATETAAAASSAVHSLSGVRLNALPAAGSVTPVEDVGRLLELLDKYQARLADQQVSLRDLKPLVDAIESQAKTIKPTAEKLDQGDRLRGIIDEALVAANLEVIKFNRGDYLSD